MTHRFGDYVIKVGILFVTAMVLSKIAGCGEVRVENRPVHYWKANVHEAEDANERCISKAGRHQLDAAERAACDAVFQSRLKVSSIP